MRDELEHALAESWTRETLAVFADYLQGEGDPRGEWIAMDLAIVRDGLDAATQQRREKLLAPYQVQGCYLHRYGFLEQRHHGSSTKLEPVFVSPAGPCIRALELTGSAAQIANSLELVARARRPLLRRLTLVPTDRREGDDLARDVPAHVLPALAAATPWLRAMELRHVRFTSFEHPRIPGGPVTKPESSRGYWQYQKLAVQVGDEPLDIVEMGRFTRMHHGIVSDLDHAAREAWAELRFTIEHLEDDFGDEVPSGRPFPAGTFDTVLASAVDVPYYGADWRPIHAKRVLAPAAEIRLRRM